MPKKRLQTTESLKAQTSSSAESIWRRKSTKIIGGIGLSAGIAAAVVAGNSSEKDLSLDSLSFTPTPSVSSAGTEAMIALNDGLRDIGPYGVAVGIGGIAAYEAARRRQDSRLGAKHDLTHQYSRKGRIIFTGTVMGIIGSATVLGDAAGEGANPQK